MTHTEPTQTLRGVAAHGDTHAPGTLETRVRRQGLATCICTHMEAQHGEDTGTCLAADPFRDDTCACPDFIRGGVILIDSALDIAREYDRLYAESEAARQAAEAREQDYRQQLHERSSDAATTGAKLATANIKLQAAEARVTELEEAIRPIVAVTSTAFSHSNAKLCPHGNDARYPTHARWCDECWDKLAAALQETDE